jgi:hypothetical protein
LNGVPLIDGAGAPGHADLHQDAAVRGHLADGVIAVVGAIDRTVRRDVDPVGVPENALAPGPQEVSVTVEHHHGVLAAIEHVNLVGLVHRDRGHLVEGPSVWQLRPIALCPVLEGPLAQHGAGRRVGIHSGTLEAFVHLAVPLLAAFSAW